LVQLHIAPQNPKTPEIKNNNKLKINKHTLKKIMRDVIFSKEMKFRL